MRRRLYPLVAVLALFSLAVGVVRAEEAKNKADEEALLKSANAFVEAFHKGDAKTVAEFWTTDGDYTDQDGNTMKGRASIEKSFKSFFGDNKGLKLRIDIKSLRFVTADVAIEDGVTSVIPPDDGPPSRARYTIVHVKKDGKWLLSSVREAPYTAPTNHALLSGLEWAIGDWASDPAKGEIARVAYSWGPNENFIISSFTTTFKNISIGGGTQWIGWDPTTKTIRSWTFETNGGFGEATWTQDGDKWTIKATGVLRDGKKLSATNIVTRIDADTISWQSKDRKMDGKDLPDISPIKMKRVK